MEKGLEFRESPRRKASTIYNEDEDEIENDEDIQ
jgi:hypothetical protein